jgi:hypothetical protein
MNQPNDASKKSPRTFQCRDQLWETFEQMARELECSIDYLINEAMKQYARQRSYGAQANPTAGRTPFPGVREPAPAEVAAQRQPLPPTAPAVPMARPGSPSMPQAQPPSGPRLPPPPPPAAPGRGVPLPPPPSGARGATPPLPPPVNRQPSMSGPPPLPRQPSMPPQIPPQMQQQMQQQMPPLPPPMQQMPPQMPPMPPPMQQMPPPMQQQHHGHHQMPQGPPPMAVPHQPVMIGGLTAVYMGERTPVSKEKFIIGRGRQTSDLTIKDPNVSRQHAMVEFQNGVFYMVDLGSTNGVEYHGQRVTRKAIAEGDVFRICDHEVAFTYR